MGFLSVISKVASRLRGDARRGVVSEVGGDLPVATKKAPFLYCLPWQVGRTLSARYSSADVPRHYQGWVYAAVRAIAQGCAACDVRFSVPNAPFHHGDTEGTEKDSGESVRTSVAAASRCRSPSSAVLSGLRAHGVTGTLAARILYGPGFAGKDGAAGIGRAPSSRLRNFPIMP